MSFHHIWLSCRYQQLSAYRIDEPGQAIRIVNAHGNCVSGLNISASSLNSINISAVAPQQWHNFTWYYSSESSSCAPMLLACIDACAQHKVS